VERSWYVGFDDSTLGIKDSTTTTQEQLLGFNCVRCLTVVNTQHHLDSTVVVPGNIRVAPVRSSSVFVRGGELRSQCNFGDATAADWLSNLEMAHSDASPLNASHTAMSIPGSHSNLLLAASVGRMILFVLLLLVSRCEANGVVVW